MAGPLVHLAAMEQVKYLSEKYLNIPINIGDEIDVMKPDVTGEHAGWNVVNSSGNLFSRLQRMSDILSDMAKSAKKDINKINSPLFSLHVRYICHYIVDAHTLGHLASDTHELEYRLERAGEFVWQKKSLEIYLPPFNSMSEFRISLMRSSRYIYNVYKSSADSWLFLLSNRFRKMIREAVKYGSEYSTALIKLSWDRS